MQGAGSSDIFVTCMRLYGITFQNTVIFITISLTAGSIALQAIPVE
jgi:hypothetical protein